MTAANRRSLAIIAVAAALLVAVLAAVMQNQDDKAAPESASEAREAEETFGVVRREKGDITAMGEVDAPLVLVEYADYRCPFCGIFARETMPVLKEEYIDTGKLRLEWRDFPVFGEESMKGAVAARAAGEQGLYWEYHAAMYDDAPGRGHLKIDQEAIMGWAKEVGVPDLEKFQEDLEDPDLRAAVEADAEEARSLGATGTPTFILGETPLIGAQPVEEFRDRIDEQLAAMGES